jgi:hypothetical protein
VPTSAAHYKYTWVEDWNLWDRKNIFLPFICYYNKNKNYWSSGNISPDIHKNNLTHSKQHVVFIKCKFYLYISNSFIKVLIQFITVYYSLISIIPNIL